jgi:ABC-type polysaccharide/polyol phosphate export permease
VYKSLYGFVPRTAVFAVAFVAVGGNLGVGIFVLPLLFSIQVVMNVGIALLVSTFVTLVDDAQNVMTYISRIFFFVTPVIYPVATMPASARAWVAWQPLFALFASYQAVFVGHIPDPILIVQAAAWAGVLLFLGGRTFLKHERDFAARL